MLQTCSHAPSTVWKCSCKALRSDAIFFFFLCHFSKGKEAPPGSLCPQSPRWDFTAAHTKEFWPIMSYKTARRLLLFLNIINISSSTLLRMPTWPACWVQVLLGTWRTWAWPSPTSPVPVPSSSSSCLHSNSSTSGPHRYTHTHTAQTH